MSKKYEPEDEELRHLQEDDPELYAELLRRMCVFEDIYLLSDDSLTTLLPQIELGELALACKTASDVLLAKLCRALGKTEGDRLKDAIDAIGIAKLADIEAAQERIIDIAKRLDNKGGKSTPLPLSDGRNYR
jgi:flagellar motor switch protein FliG